MGEVYRAYDSRLDREVAIKVVPADVADDPERLGRFEQEARAVARLSHPNILTLHDFGRTNGISYAVLELLDGETLRARLGAGALPPRKAADIGAQTARGLAAAHDKHIVHRDLKPENLFISGDGQVKILDFGLARRNDPIAADPRSVDSPTMAIATQPGVVLGTVGYMAPEQVKGEAVDHRADIFALGCVLYEMFSGRRTFAGESAPETLTAILKHDPADPAGFGVTIPPVLLRIVRRCLEKRPDERFQSARDLAFALESALEGSHSSGPLSVPLRRFSSRRLVAFALLGAGFVAGALAGARFLRSDSAGSSVLPSFRQLTFERGTIRDARFTSDGRSVLYSAAWEGNPLRIFMTRTDGQESVRLALSDARLLSISPSGEMAISLGHTYDGWMGEGTLARSSVLGTAPRVLAEHVREAEWTPDGSGLAVVRRVAALEQLEFPVGRPLYKTAGFISDIRFSPDGQLIAFADHPVFADDAGGVSVVDRAGARTQLSTGYVSIRGLSWSTDGREIWHTARTGGTPVTTALMAVTLTGQARTVWSSPSWIRLFDIGPGGRALLGTEIADRRVDALFAGSAGPVDVTLRAQSVSQWISDDGSTITMSDQAAAHYLTYVIRAGSAAVRLGDGQAFGQSPDRRWVLAVPARGSSILIHPTGAGETRTLSNPEKLVFRAVAWLPDSRRIVAFGHKEGHSTRGYVQDINEGAPRAFTAEGVSTVKWWSLPISPDGTRVLALSADLVPTIYRIDNGSAEPVRGLQAGELPVRWTQESQGLIVARGGGLPWLIERLDIASGRRTPVREIRAHEAAGLRLSLFAITPDGRHYVHSYSRLLTDLFVVDGLR
jgi:serine/threonine protein kinase